MGMGMGTGSGGGSNDDLSGMMMGLTMGGQAAPPPPGAGADAADLMGGGGGMGGATAMGGFHNGPSVFKSPARVVLKKEMGGGLEILGSFVRGPGAMAPGTSMSMTLTLRNTKDSVIRRVRINPPKAGGVKVTGLTEIAELAPNASATMQINVDAGASTREAKLDVRTGAGTYSATLSLPLEETIRPSAMSVDNFVSAAKALQGFNEGKGKFTLGSGGFERVPTTVLETVNVMPVTSEAAWQDEGEGKWAGSITKGAMPERVLITVSADKSTGSGTATVNCDDAMITAALVGVLKKALSA